MLLYDIQQYTSNAVHFDELLLILPIMKQGLKQCQKLRIMLFFPVAWIISNLAQLDYDRLDSLG